MSELTVEQKYEKAQEANRERQRRYYENHTPKILEKKQAKRDALKNRQAPRATPQPEPPAPTPAPEAPETYVIRVKRSSRIAKQPAPAPTPEPTPAPALNDGQMTIMVKKKKPVVRTADDVIELFKNLNLESESTFKTYRTDIRRIAKVIKEPDFTKILNSPAKTIPALENAKQANGTAYGTSSIKGMIQVILKMIDTLKIPVSQNTRTAYHDKFTVYDYQVREEGKKKTTDVSQAIPTADEYLKKVKSQYGDDSKQYALTSLYILNEPVRDNYGSILLTQVKKTAETDKNNNYVYIPPKNKKQPLEVFINKHKTKGKGVLQSKLSSQLSTTIRKYIQNNDIDTNGGKLFSGSEKLSGYVSSITNAVYPDIPKGQRGTKLFRQMRITKSLENDNLDERAELARRMGNSLAIQENVYVRPQFI